MSHRYRAAVLGATGAVGQRFVQLLVDHPWFELSDLLASPRSAGRPYGEAVHWVPDEPMPSSVADVEVAGEPADLDADVVFSALPGGKAEKVERQLARDGVGVFSNARDLRLADDVPLVIPEVNPGHLDLVDEQDGDGFVVCNANCTAIVLTLALAPLDAAFGVEKLHVTSLQALSGAGYPGEASLDIVDNVQPRIGGEEGKVAAEPRKMLGELASGRIAERDLPISATCTRVPVTEGHLESVQVGLVEDAPVEDLRDAVRDWAPDLPDLPSLPADSVVYHDAEDRPQPRKDRFLGDGMTISIGRLRDDPVLSARFLCLGSNTIRGAAGQSVLNAELCAKQGRLG